MLPAFQSLSTTKQCLRIVSGKNPNYPEFMSLYIFIYVVLSIYIHTHTDELETIWMKSQVIF